MAKITAGPTAELVRELLDYDPTTGVFRWRARPSDNGQPNQMRECFAGRLAGHLHGRTGYLTIKVDGHSHNAQRIAWLYMTGEWPSGPIDHINLNKSDNRFSNLRKATFVQSGQNRGRSSRNKSGVKGVVFELQTRKWKAHIRVNGRGVTLGRFATIDEAAAEYARASALYHGEFGRV